VAYEADAFFLPFNRMIMGLSHIKSFSMAKILFWDKNEDFNGTALRVIPSGGK